MLSPGDVNVWLRSGADPIVNGNLFLVSGLQDLDWLREVLPFARQVGVNLNYLNSDGETLLHKAVLMDDLPLVDLLLMNGVDPNRKDSQGRTPLQLASGPLVIRKLAQYGAEPALETAIYQSGSRLDRIILPEEAFPLQEAIDLTTLAQLNPDQVDQDILPEANWEMFWQEINRPQPWPWPYYIDMTDRHRCLIDFTPKLEVEAPPDYIRMKELMIK